MEPSSRPQQWLAEALGTGFLVFIGAGSIPATLILGNAGNVAFSMADLGMISFAFMLVIVGMVYALGHISGCHINPAVTVALAATGKFAWRDVPGYVIAQVVGATAGALAIVGTLGTHRRGPRPRHDDVRRHARRSPAPPSPSSSAPPCSPSSSSASSTVAPRRAGPAWPSARSSSPSSSSSARRPVRR